MSDAKRPIAKGRGSQLNPPNRFGGPHHQIDFEHLEHDTDYLESLQKPATEYIPDRAKSIVTENDSPDVGFRYSINPYRGCSHGCSYCYARQTHEFLGYNAGLEFETRILVKEDAPELFREFLTRTNWVPEPIALSGVTDCYQPAERTIQTDTPVFGGGCGLPTTNGDHHQERLGPTRPRLTSGLGFTELGPCGHQCDDPRCRTGP